MLLVRVFGFFSSVLFDAHKYTLLVHHMNTTNYVWFSGFSHYILLKLFVGKRQEDLLERCLAQRVVLDAGSELPLGQLHATEHCRPAHLRIVRHVVGEQTVLFGSAKRSGKEKTIKSDAIFSEQSALTAIAPFRQIVAAQTSSPLPHCRHH